MKSPSLFDHLSIFIETSTTAFWWVWIRNCVQNNSLPCKEKIRWQSLAKVLCRVLDFLDTCLLSHSPKPSCHHHPLLFIFASTEFLCSLIFTLFAATYSPFPTDVNNKHVEFFKLGASRLFPNIKYILRTCSVDAFHTIIHSRLIFQSPFCPSNIANIPVIYIPLDPSV